jgi:hypothetical protein
VGILVSWRVKFIWYNFEGLFNWKIISCGYLQKDVEHQPSFLSPDINEYNGCSGSSDVAPIT